MGKGKNDERKKNGKRSRNGRNGNGHELINRLNRALSL